MTAKGNCDDERNTAYDGPDADNTCKMPFFWDGRWYENCTLYPKDEYWCATKINPDTREMLDGECLYENFVLKKMNILKMNNFQSQVTGATVLAICMTKLRSVQRTMTGWRTSASGSPPIGLTGRRLRKNARQREATC